MLHRPVDYGRNIYSCLGTTDIEIGAYIKGWGNPPLKTSMLWEEIYERKKNGFKA
jgi:hypothetical protein